MNVLYIHRTKGKGVERVHIEGIADGLRAGGHHVDFVSPANDDAKTTSDTSNTNSSTLKSYVFSWISSYAPEFVFELAEFAYNILAVRQIRQMLVTKRYDFIYERYAIFAIAGVYMARKHKIPCVLEVNYTSKCDLVRSRSAMLAPLASKVDGWLYRNAAGIVVVSTFLRDHLTRDFAIAAEKIIVLPNAADAEKFKVTERQPTLDRRLGTRNHKVVGFVGGFYPWHGVNLLVSAFAAVSSELDDIKLLLVGDGPERQAIYSQVEQLGMQNKVIFTGAVAHGELPDYLSIFDVGVMPNSNEYGSPMKIFEYMALGKPVIAPDYGPILDVIEPERQGIIFAKNDAESLAQAILRVLTNSDLMAAMADNARTCIENDRTWSSNVQQTVDLFHRVKNY